MQVQDSSPGHSHSADPLRELLTLVRDGKHGVCSLCCERAKSLLRDNDRLQRDLSLYSRIGVVKTRLETETCPLCRICRNFDSLDGALAKEVSKGFDTGNDTRIWRRCFTEKIYPPRTWLFGRLANSDAFLRTHLGRCVGETGYHPIT